jgi:hypothetical protein
MVRWVWAICQCIGADLLKAITVRDHTMQAGRERSALPLIRRFNDHSNKLLRGGGYLSGSIDATSADLTSHKDVAGHYGNSLSNTAMPEVGAAFTSPSS